MGADFTDRVLRCVDCGEEFVFTAGEQLFFAEKNFQEPKRCKTCKGQRNSRPARSAGRRTETIAICSQCGKETTVPFQPTQGRAIYCRDCFQQRRLASS